MKVYYSPNISKEALRQLTAYEKSEVSSLTWLSIIFKKTGYLSNIPSSKAGPSRNPSLEMKKKKKLESNKLKQKHLDTNKKA